MGYTRLTRKQNKGNEQVKTVWAVRRVEDSI